MTRTLRLGRVLLFAGIVVRGTAPTDLAAQAWIAQLVLDPSPSAYLSDWEVDPSVGSLAITNPGSAAGTVSLHYGLAWNGRVVLRGTTDPIMVAGGATVVLDATSTFGGRADWDRDLQRSVTQTGRLPEGEYEGCVSLVGAGGALLAPRECAQFSLRHADPPYLVFPLNGDTVATQSPIFEWMPVQLPSSGDGRVGYVLQIAEVRGGGRQPPEVSLESSIPLYLEPDLAETAHEYPVGAPPLVHGRTYAWRVQALGADGKPVATNLGRSEVWTFTYAEPEAGVDDVVARIELSLARDTLRHGGDTTRATVRAFDADGVELPGRRIPIRTLDARVANVDSGGVVRAEQAGETRLVASLDGLADSASIVTGASAGARVTLGVADAEGDGGSLLSLITSGSFDEVVPQLLARLESGTFRIPLPRLLAGGSSGAGPGGPAGAPDDGAGASAGGPRASSEDGSGGGARECADVSSAIDAPRVDRERRLFTVPLPIAGDQWNGLRSCVAPNAPEEARTDSSDSRRALFVVSWEQPGLPAIVLAIKGIYIPLRLSRTPIESAFLVLNLGRETTVGAALVPSADAAFFGDAEFDAGPGLTWNVVRRCTSDAGPVCAVARWANPDRPLLTFNTFLGVNTSETAVSRGRVGSSLALGLTWTASLPVRRYADVALGSLSLDSTQVGLMIAVQDSMTFIANDTNPDGEGKSNWSIGVSPTIAAWLSDARGRGWAFEGAIGIEYDPSDLNLQEPKLVASLTLAQSWQASVLRLGNPLVVFTTPLGPREKRVWTTLAFSGTWGFGPHGPLGLAPEEESFQEVGRGEITFQWRRPLTASDSASRRATREVADEVFQRQTRAVRDARTRLERATAARGRPGATADSAEAARARDEANAASKALAAEERALERLRGAREFARDEESQKECTWKLGTRCVTYFAQVSIGNGSLIDVLAAITRIAAGGKQ